MDQTTGAAGRWNKLDADRRQILDRGRACADVTLPALLPPDGMTERDQIRTPYQSVGARAVNNLASKLLLTLYRPNSPYFKHVIEPMYLERLKTETGDPAISSKYDKVLAKYEDAIMKFHEVKADRVALFGAIRHLIVVGNVLVYQDKYAGNKLRVFRLDQYVVLRDPAGKPKEIIVREMIDLDDVPEQYRGLLPTASGTSGQPKSVPLFTSALRVEDKWVVNQEIAGHILPESVGGYDDKSFPLLALTWTLHPGEHYGRGHVEENLGDFISLEGLRKAFLEGAAALAKLVFLVNPNGSTKKEDLMKAPNGGFAPGVDGDVTVLQASKLADFQFVQSEIIRLEGALSKAFLLVESVQRQAERVTAEEIRMMAADLDDTLGGIYTLLAQDLQAPLLRLRMEAMRQEKKLPPLPKEIQVSITTGFDALGRGHEVVKLQQFLQLLSPFGPEVVARMVGVGEYARRAAVGIGLNPDGLVPDDETLAQQDQQANQQALIQQLLPQIIQALSDSGQISQLLQQQGQAAMPA